MDLKRLLETLAALPYKATFRPPLVYLREPFFQWQNQIRIRQWLYQVRQQDCKIHPSIEIRGQKDFAPFIHLEDHCIFEKDCLIWIADEAEANPELMLGNNVYLGRNVYLGVYQPLTIGQNSLIGAYSYLITANHRFENPDIPIRLQGYTGASIQIGQDVWLGCHVVILPGVTVGDGAVIAAGAVVNKNVPAYEVWGGVPARKLRERSVSNQSSLSIG